MVSHKWEHVSREEYGALACTDRKNWTSSEHVSLFWLRRAPPSSLVCSSFISMSNERHCFILKTLLFLHPHFLVASVIFQMDLFHLKLASASSGTTMKKCWACDLAWTSAVTVLATVAGMSAQILRRLELSRCTSCLMSQEFLAATCHCLTPLSRARPELWRLAERISVVTHLHISCHSWNKVVLKLVINFIVTAQNSFLWLLPAVKCVDLTDWKTAHVASTQASVLQTLPAA